MNGICSRPAQYAVLMLRRVRDKPRVVAFPGKMAIKLVSLHVIQFAVYGESINEDVTLYL